MSNKSIGLLTMVFGADMKGFDKAMRKAEKSVAKFGKNMQKMGANMTRNITLPLVAVGGAAAKLSMDFETSMTKIQTLVGLTGEEVRFMKDRVLELAGETAMSPKELAEGLFFLTSAGLRGANAMETLEQVAKGTTAGLGDMESLSRTVAAAQNAYGVETMNAAQALDVFGGMVQTGMFKSEELAQVLGTNLGLAANLGISFEEVGAFIATYTKTTGDANAATTGFGAVMMQFAKIAPVQERALAKINMTADSLRKMLGEHGLQQTLMFLDKEFKANNMQLSEFFTKSNALKGVMGVLGNQTETYVDILGELGQKQGFVDRAFDRTSQTSGFAMKQAFASIKVAGIQLGDSLAPIIRSLASMIGTLARFFSNLSLSSKENIARFLALAAAIGPVVFIMGKMISVIVSVTKVMRILNAVALANPYVLLAAAIGAVAFALSDWGDASEKVRTNTERLAEIQVQAQRMVGSDVQRVKQLTEKLKDENLSLHQKKKALNELKQISPEYYGSLNANKLDLIQLTKATDFYTQTIIKQAEAEAMAEKIGALKVERQKTQIFVDANKKSDQHVIKGMVKEAKQNIKEYDRDIKSFTKMLDKTNQEIVDLQNKAEEELELSDKGHVQRHFESGDDFKKQIEASQTELQKLQTTVRENEDALRDLMITGGASQEEIDAAVKKLTESQTKLNDHTKEYEELMGIASTTGSGAFEKLQEDVALANEKLKEAIANGEDYEKALADYEKAVAKLKEKQDEYNNAIGTTVEQKLPAFIQLVDKFFPKLKIFGKTLGEIFKESGETIAHSMSMAIEAFSMFNNQQSVMIKNRQKQDEQALDERLRAETDAINNSNMTEEQRMRALAILEGEIANERVAIEEKAEKKLRAIKKRQAIADKALAITQIIQNTAAGMMKAYAQTGIFGGPIAAGIIGALGAAQIALVASTPIPLAEGGIVTGPTHAIVGDNVGAGSGNPEVVAPLNKLKSMLGGGGTQRVQIFGRLTGNDIYLSNQSESINRLRTT